MKIGIIGLGNMGSALLQLLCKNGYSHHVILSDVNKKLMDGKFWQKNTADNIKTSDIIFLMVKPKDMQILEHLKKSRASLIVSGVAGVSLKEIEKYTGLPVIRMMANLPVQYRTGTIVYTTNSKVIKSKLETFAKICRGPEMVELKEEEHLDVSTILAGSMPAFMSYLSEEYLQFATTHGLSAEESLKIYTSSVIGCMQMLKSSSTKEIIEKVSSPGGVTAEGIKYLQETKVNNKIKTSLQISYDKIKKLKD